VDSPPLSPPPSSSPAPRDRRILRSTTLGAAPAPGSAAPLERHCPALQDARRFYRQHLAATAASAALGNAAAAASRAFEAEAAATDGGGARGRDGGQGGGWSGAGVGGKGGIRGNGEDGGDGGDGGLKAALSQRHFKVDALVSQ